MIRRLSLGLDHFNILISVVPLDLENVMVHHVCLEKIGHPENIVVKIKFGFIVFLCIRLVAYCFDTRFMSTVRCRSSWVLYWVIVPSIGSFRRVI